MLQTIQSLPCALAPGRTAPRPVMLRIARWMLARWQAQCRRAESKDRFVPYY